MKKTPQNAPTGTPESWSVPDEVVQETWDQKSRQFAYFKELFRKRREQAPSSGDDADS